MILDWKNYTRSNQDCLGCRKYPGVGKPPETGEHRIRLSQETARQRVCCHVDALSRPDHCFPPIERVLKRRIAPCLGVSSGVSWFCFWVRTLALACGSDLLGTRMNTAFCSLVRVGAFSCELTEYALEIRCSVQLSYTPARQI